MSPPWMPLYIADYLADTSHLSAAEHGAYLLIIMHYWRNGGLPEGDAAKARIARMTHQQWRSASPVISAFFDEAWRHKRIDDELAKALEKHEKRATAGRHGGYRKASNARILPEQKDSNALASSSQPESEKKERKKDPGANAPATPAVPSPVDFRTDLFERGLDSLVAMTGKSAAAGRTFIGRLLRDAGDDAVVVLDAIERAAEARPADPSSFIAAIIRKSRGPPPAAPPQYRNGFFAVLDDLNRTENDHDRASAVAVHDGPTLDLSAEAVAGGVDPAPPGYAVRRGGG